MEIRQCSSCKQVLENFDFTTTNDTFRRRRRKRQFTDLCNDTARYDVFVDSLQPGLLPVDSYSASTALLWNVQVKLEQISALFTCCSNSERCSIHTIRKSSPAYNRILSHLPFCCCRTPTTSVIFLDNCKNISNTTTTTTVDETTHISTNKQSQSAVTSTATSTINNNTRKRTNIIGDIAIITDQQRQTPVSSSVIRSVQSNVQKSTVRKQKRMHMLQQKTKNSVKKQCKSHYNVSILIPLTWWLASIFSTATTITIWTAMLMTTVSICTTMVSASTIAKFATTSTAKRKNGSNMQQKQDRQQFFVWQYRRRESSANSTNEYYSNSNYSSSSNNNNNVSSSVSFSNSSIYTTTYATNNSWTEASTNNSSTNASTTTTHFVTSSNANKGYQRIVSFCQNNYIQVQTLQLLCDSPFAYYYGSNAYRHSEVCQSGDRANIEMDLYVHDHMIEKVVYVQIEFGLYDEFQIVNTTSLCSLNTTLVKPSRTNKNTIIIPESSLWNATNNASNSSSYDVMDYYDDDKYDDDGTASSSIYGVGSGTCLNVSGLYRVSSYYTVPKIRDNTFHYTPDVRIRFLDEHLHIVGCTVSGPYSLQVTSDARSTYGLIALTVGCSLFFLVFGTLLYKSTKDRNHHGTGSSGGSTGKSEWWIGDDLTTILGGGGGGNNSILANDHHENSARNNRKRTTRNKKQQQQYAHQNHYFRTLPNGQVLSLPIVSPATTMTTWYQQEEASLYNNNNAAAGSTTTMMMVAHPPYCSPSPEQTVTAFAAYVPSNQHPFFYKSPRPVVTATRRIPTVPTIAGCPPKQPVGGGDIDGTSSTIPVTGAGGGEFEQPQQPMPMAPYLLNIPTNTTTSDEDDDDDSDDDDDRRHVTTNPIYNETQLPTRPVI